MAEKLYKTVFCHPIHFVSFGFGTGLSPIAPGTMGTIIAIPIFLLLSTQPTLFYLIFVTIAFLIGCWTSAYTATALKVHDHPGIVIDEIIGYLITMVFVPVTWYWVILGFVFFRIFDIWKPWPISLIDQHVEGGLGIMLDDVFAGILGLLSLHIVIWSAKFL